MDDNTNTNIKDEKLNKILQVAQQASRQASRVLCHYFGNLRHVEEKFQAGLVSEADKESESVISSELQKAFPDHDFLGEETGGSRQLKDLWNADHLWVVDPLDGTTNFVHQLPIFSISIAYQERGELVLGLVDAPLLNLNFYAVKGHGAYCNGRKIKVSNRQVFRDGLFATGLSVRDENLEKHYKIISECVRQGRGIRRAGSAALDLCFVALSSYDVFWEDHLSPWDTAAGALIVQEAGGVVTNFRGEKYKIQNPDIVAGNTFLHSEILERVKKVTSTRQ